MVEVVESPRSHVALFTEGMDVYDTALEHCRSLLESLEETMSMVDHLNKRFNTTNDLSGSQLPSTSKCGTFLSRPDLLHTDAQSPKSRTQIELGNCSKLLNCCFIKLRLSMDSVMLTMQRLVSISRRQNMVLHLEWQESGNSKTSTICHH